MNSIDFNTEEKRKKRLIELLEYCGSYQKIGELMEEKIASYLELFDEFIKKEKNIPSDHTLNINLEDKNWNCKLSPTNFCIYDITNDPAMNNCLYCGKPSYDRK
jgi:hypothetical protein